MTFKELVDSLIEHSFNTRGDTQVKLIIDDGSIIRYGTVTGFAKSDVDFFSREPAFYIVSATQGSQNNLIHGSSHAPRQTNNRNQKSKAYSQIEEARKERAA